MSTRRTETRFDSIQFNATRRDPSPPRRPSVRFLDEEPPSRPRVRRARPSRSDVSRARGRCLLFFFLVSPRGWGESLLVLLIREPLMDIMLERDICVNSEMIIKNDAQSRSVDARGRAPVARGDWTRVDWTRTRTDGDAMCADDVDDDDDGVARRMRSSSRWWWQGATRRAQSWKSDECEKRNEAARGGGGEKGR